MKSNRCIFLYLTYFVVLNFKYLDISTPKNVTDTLKLPIHAYGRYIFVLYNNVKQILDSFFW